MALHVFSLIVYFIAAICMVKSTHFRGGIISWKPAENNQIEITYRVAFRRSASHFCDENAISNSILLNGEGILQCQSGCAGSITSMSYYCTDFSDTEDWTTGVRSVKFTFPTSVENTYHFGFSGCCWIALNEAGASAGWILRTMANITPRNDTGKINSSPVSAMQPIVRFIYGCSYSLRIQVADDDGDTVRCRWAKNTPDDECSGVCNTFSGSNLDEAACVLQYNATGLTGWYAVALQLEDFFSPTDTIPLSSVPLQFLIEVTHSAEPCTSRPVFPPNIITDGSVHHILANNVFNVSIYARSGAETLRVTAIDTVSPIGMIKSQLYPHGTSGREWFVVATWIPTLSQTGSSVFCFTAVDNIGQTSDQICGTLVVHGETLPSTTTTISSTQSKPDISTHSDSGPLATALPNNEENTLLIAGVAVGGLAIFGVSAFVIARVLGFGKSAQIWASSFKPDKSMINTNVNADNFYCLDYKGEYVSTTPAKSHAFSNVI